MLLLEFEGVFFLALALLRLEWALIYFFVSLTLSFDIEIFSLS